ncbi:hypothetical protein [Tropicimonas isoalkanivorans]|nr:hypothetical protein [Tropicimonas isoalkanivorans]
MDFVFKDVSRLDTSGLSQGDVIAKTDAVIDRIGQAHQYYADAPDYTHFMVLTQSCDLVRRQGNFKAPYITIAAAKPFRGTIGEFFDQKSKVVKGAEFSFHSSSLVGKAKQLIERHVNNTEPEFFFLPKSGHPNIPEDLVVFLRLSVALRKEHYDALAEAKIAELADVFQAKLGWLKGNIYSRVATPDFEDRGLNAAEIKSGFYEQYIPKDTTVWLSALQAELLRKIVNERRKEIERDLSSEEVLEIIESEIPEDIQIIANNIVERLKKNKLLEGDHEAEKKFARVISNEPSLKSLVKSLGG